MNNTKQDIINRIRGLTEQELVLYQQEFDLRKKKKAWAFLFCIFGGAIGAHRFYTGRVVSGAVYFIVGILAMALAFSEVEEAEIFGGILYLFVLGAVLVDLTSMNGYLMDYHNKVMQDILIQLKLKNNADRFLYNEKEWIKGA